MTELTTAPGPTSRATIVDVAHGAGVSRQTVSNALNRPDKVAPATLERVLAEIARLGFTPNVTAQQLRRRKAAAYGFEVNPSGHGKMGHILDEFLVQLTVAAPDHGSHLVTFAPDPDDVVEGYRQTLATGLVDGFVLADTRPGDPRPQWLLDHDVPFVSFGRVWDMPDLHQWVDVDGGSGVRQAVAHLVAAGYGRIGFLGWPSGSPVGDDRRSGWLAGLADAGRHDPDEAEAEESVQDLDQATAAAERLLARLGPGSASGLRLRHARPRRRARRPQRRTGPGPGRGGRGVRRHRRGRGPVGHQHPTAHRRGGPDRLAHAPVPPKHRTRAALPRAHCSFQHHPHPLVAGHPAPRHTHHRGAAMRRTTTMGLVLVTTSALALSACGGGGFDSKSASPQQSSGPAKLQILIGSSGDAETAAVKAAADAWGKKSGNTAEVVVAADLTQQLTQALAGGTPPDVFYVDAARIADFVKAGALEPYGDQIKDDGYLTTSSRRSPTTARSTACRRTSPRWRWRSTPTCGRRPA